MREQIDLLARVSPLVGIMDGARIAEIVKIAGDIGLESDDLCIVTDVMRHDAARCNPSDAEFAEGIMKSSSKRISKRIKAAAASCGCFDESLAIAYSLFGWHHAQLFRAFPYELQRKYGGSFDTAELDTNYFVGKNDFSIIRRDIRRGAGMVGVFKGKSHCHLARAKEIWDKTKSAHEGIAYRHARAADISYLLYWLTPSSELLRDARESIARATAMYVPEKDLGQVGYIAHELRNVAKDAEKYAAFRMDA